MALAIEVSAAEEKKNTTPASRPNKGVFQLLFSFFLLMPPTYLFSFFLITCSMIYNTTCMGRRRGKKKKEKGEKFGFCKGRKLSPLTTHHSPHSEELNKNVKNWILSL